MFMVSEFILHIFPFFHVCRRCDLIIISSLHSTPISFFMKRRNFQEEEEHDVRRIHFNVCIHSKNIDKVAHTHMRLNFPVLTILYINIKKTYFLPLIKY